MIKKVIIICSTAYEDSYNDVTVLVREEPVTEFKMEYPLVGLRLLKVINNEKKKSIHV